MLVFQKSFTNSITNVCIEIYSLCLQNFFVGCQQKLSKLYSSPSLSPSKTSKSEISPSKRTTATVSQVHNVSKSQSLPQNIIVRSNSKKSLHQQTVTKKDTNNTEKLSSKTMGSVQTTIIPQKSTSMKTLPNYSPSLEPVGSNNNPVELGNQRGNSTKGFLILLK